MDNYNIFSKEETFLVTDNKKLHIFKSLKELKEQFGDIEYYKTTKCPFLEDDSVVIIRKNNKIKEGDKYEIRSSDNRDNNDKLRLW